MLSGEFGHATLRVGDLLDLDGDVGGLPAKAGQRLMHHDARVRERVTLARGAGSEQELPHAGGEAHAHRRHVARDELHGVVDGHSRGHRTTGTVDVEPDVGVGVLALEVQELGADLVGDVVVDVGAEHHHAILQEAKEDVGAATAVAGFEIVDREVH